MSLWNMFKMELFKNIKDRANLVLMLVLMGLNILGGVVISNQNWWRAPNAFDEMMIILFAASVFASAVFLFLYPYQMARTDYKNKVMSLLIASGVSRVQYYFVKVGATLIFSFLSIILLVIAPLLIVLLSHDMSLALEFFHFTFELDLLAIGGFLFTWLGFFFMLMTAVIISRGRGYTIFVFLGISIASSQLMLIFRSMFGISMWQTTNTTMFVESLITMAIMGLIGILVIRKQDL